jgi:hypothetical protein
MDEHKHAFGVIGGDVTLCGDALEGNPGETPPPIVAPPGREVTCPRCIQVIEHCRFEFQMKGPRIFRGTK